MTENSSNDLAPMTMRSNDEGCGGVRIIDTDDSAAAEDYDESNDDFEDLGDDFEECEGDFTKRFNSARLGDYRPNRQAPMGSADNNPALRHQQLHSGEAFIQQHLNSTTDLKNRGCAEKDRSDRATVEQVLDPRTRLILFKLMQRGEAGVFERVEGCVSTGKEANVYHAVASDERSLAVKVYRTSILTFKDRDRYVSGEFRYRRGYCRHNPRKMVATWAEKEMRNLQRMHQAGLPVPKPIILKANVLVMEFIGEEGWPAPLLKNANFSADEGRLANRLYEECVWMMRRLYRQCRLVHADLSEYNLMVHEGKLVVFDVSQSVEHDHPHSLEFLRSDVANVTKFFRDKGAEVLAMRRLFEVIVDPLIEHDAEVEAILGSERSAPELQLPDDALFMKAYIPHKLEDVEHYERDEEVERLGNEPNNPYQKVIGKTMEELMAGLKMPKKSNGANPTEDESESSSDDSDGTTATSDSDEEEDEEEFCLKEEQDQQKNLESEKKLSHQQYPRVRGESPSARKSRKEAVKEDKREKRKTKVPKKVKKRQEKVKRVNRR